MTLSDMPTIQLAISYEQGLLEHPPPGLDVYMTGLVIYALEQVPVYVNAYLRQHPGLHFNGGGSREVGTSTPIGLQNGGIEGEVFYPIDNGGGAGDPLVFVASTGRPLPTAETGAAKLPRKGPTTLSCFAGKVGADPRAAIECALGLGVCIYTENPYVCVGAGVGCIDVAGQLAQCHKNPNSLP